MKNQKILVILIIYILIGVLGILSYREKKKLLKYSSNNKIFNHAKNSLIQAQKFLCSYSLLLMIIDMTYKVICCTLRYCIWEVEQCNFGKNKIVVILLSIKSLWLFISVFWAFFYGYIFARIIYTFTEVKHISPYDYMGRMNKDNLEAKSFFKNMTMRASIMIIAVEILLMYNNIIIFSIVVNMGIVVILILGLADLLQHENYYKDDYLKERKELSLTKRLYIENIKQYLKDVEYRRKRNEVLIENFKNIGYGMLNMFIK